MFCLAIKNSGWLKMYRKYAITEIIKTWKSSGANYKKLQVFVIYSNVDIKGAVDSK